MGLADEHITTESVVGYSPLKLKALRIMKEQGIEFAEALRLAQQPAIDLRLAEKPTKPKTKRRESLKERNARILREAQAEVDRIAPNA